MAPFTDVRAPVADDERVAVGRRACDPADADVAGRAATFSTTTG